MSFDLDVGFVHAPRVISRSELGTAFLLQDWRVILNPTVDSRVIHTEATLSHHFFKVSVAQRVPQVPSASDTKQDDLSLIVSILEQLRLVAGEHEHGSRS